MSEKRIALLTLWSLSLISIVWLLTEGLLTGIITATKMRLLRNVFSTCSSTNSLECVEKKVPLNTMTDSIALPKELNTSPTQWQSQPTKKLPNVNLKSGKI